MSLTFSAESATLSARLYAEGFSLPIEEAEEDLRSLCRAGAIPLSLSDSTTVLSQGFGIPMEIKDEKILYLYALTTDRATRGQGLLRTLLRESADMAKRRGFSALCLLPATTALADAYQRMGFSESLPAGGAPHIEAPADLALRIDTSLHPITPDEHDALYRAIGAHMTREMFDFSLSTLAPSLIPMRAAEGYALVLASDPHHAIAASFTAPRKEEHTILTAPLGKRLPSGILEPLPR